MEMTMNELDTIIGKTLGVYRSIVTEDRPEVTGSILQKDAIFNNLDDVIDMMFEIRRREMKKREHYQYHTMQKVINRFDERRA